MLKIQRGLAAAIAGTLLSLSVLPVARAHNDAAMRKHDHSPASSKGQPANTRSTFPASDPDNQRSGGVG